MKLWAIICMGLFSIPAFGQDQNVVPPSADPATDCVKNTCPFYTDWVSFEKPLCWCYPRNCRGDADGKPQGHPIIGYWFVGSGDLDCIIRAWMVKEPPKGPGILSIPGGICCDFARDRQGAILFGFWRVGTNDLNILVANWQVKEPPKGLGVLDCMATGCYNFFVNP